MYARTYITNVALGRAQASRAQANLRLRRPRLRGLGDATSDWWAAYDLRNSLAAQAAALLAQGTPLQAQLTSIYNQMMAMPGYNGNPGPSTAANDAQYSALSAQYGPLQAQIVSLSNQRNAILQQYSTTDWILTTPAPGPRPAAASTASTSSTTAVPVTTVSTSPASTTATTTTAPATTATSTGDWLSDLLTPSISIPILGNVPTVYAIGGAALLAWIAIESLSHKHR